MVEDTTTLIHRAHAYGETSPDTFLVETPSLGTLLADRATSHPTAIYLRYYDDDAGESSTYTYAQFQDAVNRAAGYLAARGLKPGDCFATLSYNHPTAAVLLFAGWQLGLIVAPQNVSEDDARIRFILGDAQAKLFIVHPAMRDRAMSLADGIDTVTFDDLRGESLPATTDDHRRRPALIVYTSGTTGQPKGVMLTQYNLLINAQGTMQWHEMNRDTRMMCVLPIHHVNGIVVTLVTSMMAGTTLVLNKGFKVSTFWQRLIEERVAIVSVVPTILQFLCEAREDISARDLSAFRYFVCGAGTLAVSLVEKFQTQFNVPVLHGYGLSETTAFTCTMPAQSTAEQRRRWYVDFGYPSIGAVFPHCEMAIHDGEGNTMPAGERGEIVIRGHYIMEGYYHRPDANAETFKHAWFRSGDEGFFERGEDGKDYFFITGRLKELINRGGVKYSPFEIEEVLLSIPGVKVGLAIGFENEWYGEEVGAYVVLEDGSALTEAGVIAACRELMPFAKSPKVVVFGVDVPVTVTGKYQRLQLRSKFLAFAETQFRG